MFFIKDDEKEVISQNVDPFGDSYARDTSVEELREVSMVAAGEESVAK